MKFRGYNKYKAKTCKCNQAHIHHSRGEAGYCNRLFILKKQGIYTEIETQKQFDFIVNGVKIMGHRPDFLVTLKDGKQEVHEFKGFPTDKWIIQKKLFKALYPGIPYLVKTEKDLW